MSSHVHHITPVKTLLATGIALICLTLLTVGIAYLNLPHPWNVIVALGIAVIKASLVVMFFMNLYYESRRFNILVFVGGLVFFSIFVTLTLMDTLFRTTWIPGF